MRTRTAKRVKGAEAGLTASALMKPDVSLIPEPDRSTVQRKPLTAKQRAQLALDQKGLCGCGCGGKLDHAREGAIDEHLRALGLQGTNAMENRSLWRKPCSDAKTYGSDLPTMAKADAQSGKTGQWARRQKRGKGLINSKGFEKPKEKKKWPKRPMR